MTNTQRSNCIEPVKLELLTHCLHPRQRLADEDESNLSKFSSKIYFEYVVGFSCCTFSC